MGVPRLVLEFLKLRISIVEAVRLHGCAGRFFEFAKFRIPKYLNSKICVRWTCWRSRQTLPSARVTKNASALLNVSAGCDLKKYLTITEAMFVFVLCATF